MLYDVYTTFIYILQWLEHCICRPSASALLKHRSDQISEVHSSSRASGILCSDNFLASLTQLPGPRKLFDVWRICYSVDQRTIPHYSLQRPAHLGFAHAWRICGLQGCQTNKSRWIDIRWYKSIQLMSRFTRNMTISVLPARPHRQCRMSWLQHAWPRELWNVFNSSLWTSKAYFGSSNDVML